MTVVRRVPVEDVRPLRAAVLRPGLPMTESVYPEDDLATTLHLAASAVEGGPVVGCATFFPEPWLERPAWRLRGMATAPEVRGRGLGGALLATGLDAARRAGCDTVWCNARTVALGFYRRYGFETYGEEFVTAHGIPHYAMWLRLPQQ